MRKHLLSLAGALLLPLLSFGQFWEFGVFGGGSNYSGDLSPSAIEIGETGLCYGAIVRANVSKKLTLKGNIYQGRISGTDLNATDPIKLNRNLSFRSNVLDIGANVEWNLLGFEAGSRRNRFSPYLFTGFSVFGFNPEAYYDINPVDNTPGEWVRLQPLGTEGQGTTQYNDREKYALSQIAIPMGAGLKFNLGNAWNLGMEMGFRKTFTDYLDDVSKTYANPQILGTQSGANAAALSNRSEDPELAEKIINGKVVQRGDATTQDWYMMAGITVTYTILPNACFKF